MRQPQYEEVGRDASRWPGEQEPLSATRVRRLAAKLIDDNAHQRTHGAGRAQRRSRGRQVAGPPHASCMSIGSEIRVRQYCSMLKNIETLRDATARLLLLASSAMAENSS
jgi:hypothetical protein